MPTLTAMKRLTRPASLPHAHRMTARDAAILRAVATHRFMSSEQVYRYLAIFDPTTSHQQVLRRLQFLYYIGALDRPAHQALIAGPFSCLIYGLGRDGARKLADSGHPVDPHLLWQLKNARATAPYLLHTLATTNAMLLFERDCHTAQLRLVDHHAQLALFPPDTQKLDRPFQLRVEIRDHHKPIALAVTPDRLISLMRPDTRRYNLCIEIDRGTESVVARKITKTSFARKITTYHAAWKAERHKVQWNMQGFRVATITTSVERIAHILEAQREIIDSAHAMFLYTTTERFEQSGPLAPIWITSDGDGVSLIERT